MPFKDPEKSKEAKRRYYEKNKEVVSGRVKNGRRNNRSYIQEYKEGKPCTDCGIVYPHYVMDLDHRNPGDKVDGLARMAARYGLEAVKRELEKCDVVCSNCHRERTHQQRQTGLFNGT